MQIGSGQSALSLALLKALGTPPAATPGAQAVAKAGAVKEAAATAAERADPPGSTRKVPAATSGNSGGCTPPRGSFVDLRA